MPVNKLFDKWTWAMKLPDPFDTLPDSELRRKDVNSKYTVGSRTEATIHPGILRAVFTYMDLATGATPPSTFSGAIGSQNNDLTVCEYPSHNGDLQVVVFNQNSGKFFAGCYTDPVDEDSRPLPYALKDSGQSGTALLFSLLPTAMADDEFNAQYQELKDARDNGYSDMELAAKTAAILCDNLYRRIAYADQCGKEGILVNIAAGGNIPNLKPFNLKNGTYLPTNVIFGTFEVLKPNSNSTVSIYIPHNDFIGKYKLSERQLTADEKNSIPELPNWYVIPPEVKRICEHARLTTNSQQPMRNYMMRGNAGSGKTEGAKAVAAGLHLPYRSITCSANTEIFDLLGQIIPDTGGQGSHGQTLYPTLFDIQMDPASAYHTLTGQYDEGVSEADVYQELLRKAKADAQDTLQQEDGKQRFKYVDTPLVEAIRNGYCLEIQEPTVIANPGVLVGLNSLLDRCNSVTLPTGETISRHLDTVIIVTANNEYAGCKGMNQSVISRMNLIMDIPEPDEDTMVKRVSGITGCSDLSAVRLMAKLVRQISTHCREAMITDGSCGVRELIAWVQSYMICGDIMEAARYTVLSSVSSDEDCRIEVQETCLDTELAS